MFLWRHGHVFVMGVDVVEKGHGKDNDVGRGGDTNAEI